MDHLETRITKIEKKDSSYILHVDVYTVGMITDEYEYQGCIYLEDLSVYDPKTSVSLVQNKSC